MAREFRLMQTGEVDKHAEEKPAAELQCSLSVGGGGGVG